MASTFHLEIATPDRKFFSDTVEMVVVYTPQGELGILPGHEPLLVGVASGPIQIKKDGAWQEAALTLGFMEITQEKTVILCDTAEWPDEIDANRAKAAKERAEEKLVRQLSKLEYIRTQAALHRAITRLKVKKGIL